MPRYSRDNPSGLPLEPAMITEQRACRKCGYSLTGLKLGGKCPECGLGITGRKSFRHDEHIDEAPRGYLRTVRAGGLLTFIAAPLGVLCIGAVLLTPMDATLFQPATTVACALAMAWWGGVFLVTTRRPGAMVTIEGNPIPRPADRTLRAASRCTQALWPLAMILMLINARFFLPNGAPSDVISLITGVCLISAFVTSVLYLFYVAVLCSWAGDEEAAQRLRLSPFAAFIGVLLPGSFLMACLSLIIAQRGIGFFSGSGLLISGIAFCFFMSGLLRGLFGFQSLMGWAVKNQSTSEEIQSRISQRIQQRLRENTFHE